MKNLKLKKGLALLVLVCMLFTIMPASAFAAAPQKTVTVTVHFMDLDGVSHGFYQTQVPENQEYLRTVDFSKMPEGYKLAGITPDLRIKTDSAKQRFVAIRVIKIPTELVTLIVDPNSAVTTPDFRPVALEKNSDGTVTVPKMDKYFKAKDGYYLKEVMATGFNGSNDGSFKVKEGQRLLITHDTPIIHYVLTNKVVKKEQVTFLATPGDAVSGREVVTTEVELNDQDKLIVPAADKLFTKKEGYVLKEIKATGFNLRLGTFNVKEGDALSVTDKNPVLKYVYEKAEDDVVVMTIGSTVLNVNGQKKVIDTPAMVKDARTYVPLRALAEAFGASVDYDDASRTVTAKLDGTTVVMEIGSRMYSVNGHAKFMDVAPFIENSRTMLPIRFAAEAFGMEVTPVYNADGTTAEVVFVR